MICPFCKKQTPHDLSAGDGVYSVTCGSCKKPFRSRLMFVRAFARGSDWDGSSARLRMHSPNGEELIDFEYWRFPENLELRSHDAALLTYDDASKLKIIENLTVRRAWFARMDSGKRMGLMLGAIFAVIGFMFLLMGAAYAYSYFFVKWFGIAAP